MRVEIATTSATLAERAAALLAGEIADAVAARGRASLALSGGRTPAGMLERLAERDVPWARLHVFQVDERDVADGHSERNLTLLRERLLDRVPLPAEQVHPMPVSEGDLDTAAARYDATLRAVCGDPPRLDVVHLGLGADGHTASLVPGDPALEIAERDVAATQTYAAHRRLTLTYPVLNRARRVLWLVSGADKHTTLSRLLAGDPAIPAGRVARERAIVLTDMPAGGTADTDPSLAEEPS